LIGVNLAIAAGRGVSRVCDITIGVTCSVSWRGGVGRGEARTDRGRGGGRLVRGCRWRLWRGRGSWWSGTALVHVVGGVGAVRDDQSWWKPMHCYNLF